MTPAPFFDSLFDRLPTPALLADRGIAARRSHVTLTVTLALLPVLSSSPRIFDEKRGCSNLGHCVNKQQYQNKPRKLKIHYVS